MPESTVLESSTQSNLDIELFKDEKATAQYDPLFLVECGLLSIKTKDGRLIRLEPNDAQQIVIATIRKRQREKKPIRIWILKARQEGISTVAEAIIFSFSSQQENFNTLIMADEGDKSDYLFEMSKLYHKELAKNEPHLAPRLKKSNAKKLEFDEIHSQIIIESAENPDAARAYTYQVVHLSEVSRFRDLKTVMDGLNQSVPDIPNSIILAETTANGMEVFYEEWIRAIEGKTDWIPLFIAWYVLSEYQLPLENGELYPINGILFDSNYSQARFLMEEEQLKADYNLTNEQLNWRRHAIINKCGGRIEIFWQEYPTTWQEAFQVSGFNFFDQFGLAAQKAIPPIAVGEIFEIEMRYQFRDLPDGRIKIFEWPKSFEQYILTADASEALGQDEASILVLDKRSNATVAEVSGQITPEELAHLGIMLGNYYNRALVAPENKGYGYMVCNLMAKKYGNMYYKRNKLGQVTKEIGYNTNVITRPQYLAQFNEEIRNRATQLNSAKLISQCQTFIIDPKTLKAEAAAGKQDGLVICRAIAGQVRCEYPYKRPLNSQTIETKRRTIVYERTKLNKNGGFKYRRN